MNHYKIIYKIKTAQQSHGEFSLEQKVEELTTYAVTNDLNELFTDLYDAHRYTGIIGIEITGVEHCIDGPPASLSLTDAFVP